MNSGFHFKHYSEFIDSKVHKSLKETSKDDHEGLSLCDEYMTEVKTRVIDFDEVKKNYLKNKSINEDNAKSIDALYMANEKICMVEFKNGDFSGTDIIEKAISSVLIFIDITGYNLSDFRNDSIFILVYNGDEKKIEYRQVAAKYKAKKSRTMYSYFGLEHLYRFCFNDVHELEKDEFNKSLYSKDIIGY